MDNEVEQNFEFRGYSMPSHIAKSLEDYFQRGTPVGDFLQAVIANELFAAIGQADECNIRVLPAIAAYAYLNGPIDSTGSRENYKEWVRSGGLAGLRQRRE